MRTFHKKTMNRENDLKMRPMRILQVVSSSATSGAERHVFTLARMLKQRGHLVEVVCPEGGWLITELGRAGIPVYPIQMKGRSTLAAHLWMLKLVHRSRFDLIHAHLTRAAYLGFTSGMLRGVPLVATVHVANSDSIYRVIARSSNRLVAVSNYIRGVLHGRRVPDRFIDVVYNGTDFADIESVSEGVHDELGISANRELVGLVARVCREKGHMLAVDAMSRVVKERSDAHMLFVGRIEAAFEPEIREAAQDYGVSDRITFMGNREDIPRLLDAMSFSILPSSMESFGLAALESMARGRTLVATRVGGLEELIEHQETGLLIDQDPGQLAEGMHYLLDHRCDRERMGQNARRTVLERFTLGQMVERLEAVYERAAGI